MRQQLNMANHLRGLWRLTRFDEYVAFVVVTTLLGAAAKHGRLGLPLLCVLAANWLAVGFAFMINDIEDAPDDARDPAKARRNPISAGMFSARKGRAWAYGAAGLALILYASLGPGPLVAGSVCILLSYLYSWRPIRLKAIPLIDVLSHAAIGAGLLFLAASWTYPDDPAGKWLFPALMVLFISMYGQLFNELRDFDGDLQSGVTHTASFLGARATHLLMLVCLAIGIFAAGMALIVDQFIPAWVLLLMLALTVLLVAYRLVRKGGGSSTIKLHQAFQKPVEIAAAIALTMWFASAWIAAGHGLFSLLSSAR
jgi:4-hydroxybenzoate polyprenyltransferase